MQYGPTTAYGSQTARDTIEVQANTAGFVFPVLRGLQRDTAYHYRLCAQDSQDRWGTAVSLENASRNLIRNVRTADGGAGVRIVGGADNEA